MDLNTKHPMSEDFAYFSRLEYYFQHKLPI